MTRIEDEPIERKIELGEIISDPASVIENFKEVKSGRITEEDYISWIKDQAVKVEEEAKRREENPPVIPNDSTGEPKFYIQNYESFQVTTVIIDDPQGKNGLGLIDMVDFQFNPDGRLTGFDARMLRKMPENDQNAELIVDFSGQTAHYRYNANQRFDGKLGLFDN